MAEHTGCLHEQDFGKLWEILKTLSDHCIEGDKVGGFRDRLLQAEISIKALKERFWQSSLIGAVIGTLVGAGCKEAIQGLISWIIKK